MESDVPLTRRLAPALILGGIFALALFIRSYFAYGLAVPNFLVSGGSDSYYFEWIIANILATGKHLVHDPMLNFPLGMVNPRPPVYSWSVALTGLLVGSLQGNVDVGVGQALLWSTALWGALTIFPTYYLAKEMFGRRTGYVAAFFLAVLAAHIQRTALSNADHDALALFFIVTGFYFFLRALGELRERTWVESWVRPRAIFQGLRELVTESRRAILFSILAGTALATVALTWKGYAYAVVIIIAYFLAQLLVHQVRNRDPLGVVLVYTVTLGTAFLLAFPYYQETGQIRTWFDIPVYLFAAAAGLGLLFTFFHRLPWLLVIPPVLVGFGVGTYVAATLSPTVAQALASGLGYFVRTKIFETIQEAQPPNFSQGILSFGPVTALMAFAGLALMAWQYVRRPRPDFLFALVWMVAAVFMAMSAVRFLFNASPAFAIAAAWVTVLLVEQVGLDAVRKAVAATGGSKWMALRRGLKARHVAGALFVAFLLVLPNVFGAVDAASPFEAKEDLNAQLEGLPSAMRFGGFGFSLPLETRYFPQAWSWLATRDTDVHPMWERPAFLSWWDYGFEAIQETRHPTVADNFQNGIPVAGHWLMAQGEAEAIAVLNVRLLQGEERAKGGELGPAVRAALADHGLDPDLFLEVLRSPARFIPLIRSEPDRFGRWDERLLPQNAEVIYLKVLQREALDLEGMASLYRVLRGATGTFIGYFAVDSRLIPFSGRNTGIFYAPAKLSDHRIRELPNQQGIPTDFYRLIAETNQGEFAVGEEPPGTQVTNIRIEYQDMFYASMVYRTFFGPRGEALGVEETGLPGLSGAMAQIEPRPGWMLNHFRQVYRTAYFNPFPPDQVANHTDAWRAVNYVDALEIQQAIEAGEREGTVDISASGLQQGIVVLQYYDGAILRGTVRAEGGGPLSSVRVTALDEGNIPHDTVLTDESGGYELLLPFGQVRVVASVGDLDNRTATGSRLLTEETLVVTEAQAMREPLDEDEDGRADYLMRQDFLVPGGRIQGQAFLDGDRDGERGADEPLLPGAEVRVGRPGEPPQATVTTDEEGRYEVTGLLPDTYRVALVREGIESVSQQVTVGVGGETVQDLGLRGTDLRGEVTDADGLLAVGTRIELREAATGTVHTAVVNATGEYQIPGLPPGNYTLTAQRNESGAVPVTLRIRTGVVQRWDFQIWPQGELAGRSLVAFSPTPHVNLVFSRRGGGADLRVTTGADARYATSLPVGTYDVHAFQVVQDRSRAFLGTVVVGGGTQTYDANLETAYRVEGTVREPDGDPATGPPIVFASDAGRHQVLADADGRYVVFLPAGNYRVTATTSVGGFVGRLDLPGTRQLELDLVEGLPALGRVFRDWNGNGTWDPGEGVDGLSVRLIPSDGLDFVRISEADGFFDAVLDPDLDYTVEIAAPGYETLSLGPLPAAEVASLTPLRLVAESVSVTGRLEAPDGLDLTEVPITFEATGRGGANVTAATSTDGAFAAQLLPGRYRVTVDAPQEGNESVRVQSRQATVLQVRAAEPLSGLLLEVVERVRVHGILETGSGPFVGNLAFRGPENRSVAVNGAYEAFLRPGTYTLHGTPPPPESVALLESLTVSAPTNFSRVLDSAAVATGFVRIQDEAVGTPLPLTFARTSDGAAVEVDAGANGAYRAVLVPGTYRVTAEFHGVDRLDGPARFVRYDLNTTLTWSGNANRDLSLTRSLDNVTVEIRTRLDDQLVGAEIRLRAANETAMGASAATPPGTPLALDLAPGTYDVYAHRASGNLVALTRVTFAPGTSTVLDLPLVTGHRVSGVVSLDDGSAVAADLRFARPTVAEFVTDAQGLFEIYLPAGTYQVSATAERTERAVEVEYRETAELGLSTSAVLSLTLDRVDRPGVTLSWEPDQRVQIEAGGTAVYTVRVENTGNVEDTYTLEGFPGDWAFDLEPERVTLPFGTSNGRTITVRIAAPDDALVNHAPLQILAQSTTNSSVTASVTVELDIEQFYGLTLRRAEASPVLSPQGLTYTLELANDGNGEDRYTVVLLNPDTLRSQGWEARLRYQGENFTTRVVGVEADARASATVTLLLEPTSGEASIAPVALRAFSEVESDVTALLDFQIAFPRLELPSDRLALEGTRLSLGPPGLPLALYTVLGAVAVVGTVLLLRYTRGRSGR